MPGNEKMRLKLIVCDVLLREVCHLLVKCPHVFDLEFTEKDSHNNSETLRSTIQQKIDESTGKGFDAILLGYGICGNATVGIEARDTRLVIPRAHDCCTLFLGSRKKFRRHFKDNPSQPFSSAGYMERSNTLYHDGFHPACIEDDPKYKEYIAQYGEENARYIYETMYGEAVHPEKIVFIEIPETRHLGYAEVCRQQAEENGMQLEILDGSLAILRKLLCGDWDEADFLTLEPGERSKGIYDWDRVIGKAAP